MSSQLTMPSITHDLVDRFIPDNGTEIDHKQRERLFKQLQAFIEYECSSLKWNTIGSTVVNQFYGIVLSQSIEDATKDVLTKFAINAITNQFRNPENFQTLQLKADALSEFLMKYLVTSVKRELEKNKKKKKSKSLWSSLISNVTYVIEGRKYFIDEKEWDSEKMDQLTIDEIIERAINGNGFHLPKHDTEDLIKLLKAELERFKSLDSAFSLFMNRDIIRLEVLSQVDTWKLVLHELGIINQEIKGILEDCGWIQNLDIKNYQGTRELLYQNLNDLRSLRFRFQDYFEQINEVALLSHKYNIPDHHELLVILLNLGKSRLQFGLEKLLKYRKINTQASHSSHSIASSASLIYDPNELEQVLVEYNQFYDVLNRSTSHQELQINLTELYIKLKMLTFYLLQSERALNAAGKL